VDSGTQNHLIKKNTYNLFCKDGFENPTVIIIILLGQHFWDVINRIWDEEAGFGIVFPSSAAHSRVHTHTPEGLPEGG
jgi:hypothetical protein